jgi:transcriptional regulator with XRE-family HTH domain
MRVGLRRRFRPLAAPVGVSAIVSDLFELMTRRKVSISEIADESGINKNTIYTWRISRVPSITNFEAVANALGYKLRLVEIPPGSADDPEDV